MQQSVELIIPSLDRLERLSKTLRAVRRLYPDLPVRVALQGPDLRGKLHAVLPDDPNLTIDYHERPGLIPAINAAFRNSAAEICILLDDDAVPCDGWLEAHLSALEDDSVAYTFGREVNARTWRSPLSELMRMCAEAAAGLFLGREKKLHGRIVGWINPLGFVFANFHLPGSCMINAPAEGNFAIRRETFLAMGGYRQEFRGNCWGYGPELGVRLARQGKFGRYVGDAVMIHRPHVSGGTRVSRGRAWYRDYVYNNKLLVETVGLPWAWIGAAPRLIRRIRG